MSQTNTQPGDIATAIAESRKPTILQTEGQAIPIAAIPDGNGGYKIESLEEYQTRPAHKQSRVEMHDTTSFVEYVTKHMIAGKTVVYLDVDPVAGSATFVAVIDDDAAGEPSWRKHQAVFSPRLSVEWGRWKKNSGAKMSQGTFAYFLEGNQQDIRALRDGMPAGADMLKMATEFEANSNKSFKSKINTGNGSIGLAFVDAADNATVTKMQVFERFGIVLRVFIQNDPARRNEGYPLEARLRYRVDGTRLELWYELIRPDLVFAQALDTEIKAVKEGVGCPLLFGKPGIKD